MPRSLAAGLFAGLLIVAPAAAALAQSPPGLAYIQPLAPPAVQSVQQALRNAGDYNGAVDGTWGPDSESALQRFQQAHNLQPNGQLNDATASALGLQAPQLLQVGSQAAAPAPQPRPPERLTTAAVRNIQAQLRRLGFYNGGVDGQWGPGSQAALTNFQANRGLQATGQLNPETVKAMGLNPYDPAQPPQG